MVTAIWGTELCSVSNTGYHWEIPELILGSLSNLFDVFPIQVVLSTFHESWCN